MPNLIGILEIMRKPIEYATREEFAYFKKVQDIDSFLNDQIEAALKSTKAASERYEIRRLQTLLKNYQQFSEQDRKQCLLCVKVILEGLIQKVTRTSENVSRPMSHVSGPTSERVTCNVQHDPQIPRHTSEVTRPKLEHITCSVQRDPFEWTSPVQYIKGVGPQRARLLEKVGIRTVEDALYFLPRRYEDRGNLKPISQLISGESQTICGEVMAVDLVVTPRRGMRILELALQDKTGTVYAKWFNQPYLKNIFKKGQRLVLSGKSTTNRYYGHALEMENPNYEILDAEDQELLHTGRIVPIYPETKGLSSRPIRLLTDRLFELYSPVIPEILPEAIRKEYGLLPLSQALQMVHFPLPGSDLARFNRGNSDAHRRLIFDEFFLLELGLALKKRGVQEEEKGIHFEIGTSKVKRFIEQLPFQLTTAQRRVMDEIQRDMASVHPMNRLIQGDVGSGKTVVALFAMFIAVENNYQAVLMVPTEILAEQHYLTLGPLLDRLGISCALLTSGHSREEKKRISEAAETGSASILIGTHALLQEGVRFQRLGLAVIDEQHKFGVLQRATLTRKGYHPDVLILTATPIPRTLALSVYGDLDLSILDEMPPGRKPVITKLFNESQRQTVYSLIEKELSGGHQVYVVYPLVEESEKVDLKAAVKMAGQLEEMYPRYHVGLLHGKMKSQEKEQVMRDLSRGKIQLLVSTTVIEVGIDVSNATVMLIEHAERFGLAQLHQLRGRVGRGAAQAYCYLLASFPRSEDAKRRLGAMVK
ncbi:MAG TPA: ATP-dependent DNA helicase RecG, partial [Nitrospiria bacterium]|nr:ATP-dependent DNA helicase RecG [Nitrospiria bacterium]